MRSTANNGTKLQIWTIGHSNHPPDRFVELLRQHEIRMLIDVRRFPGSRTFPHFGQDILAQSLRSAAIEYRWIEGLGGRRASPQLTTVSPNEGWRNKSFRNYADYMMTAEFRVAFAELFEIAAARETAIMCSESVFWRCHRRLISDYATVAGIAVSHIFPAGNVKPHALTHGAVAEPGETPRVSYPPEPQLFD